MLCPGERGSAGLIACVVASDARVVHARLRRGGEGMERQQRLRLGDADTLRASWARFTEAQRRQVIVIFAELIARAARKKEASHEPQRK